MHNLQVQFLPLDAMQAWPTPSCGVYLSRLSKQSTIIFTVG